MRDVNTTVDRRGDTAPDDRSVYRAVAASAMGNCIEWFDFGVFTAGVMTSIIGTVFFSGSEGGSATLRSFALVAAAFVTRPFGGLFFGPLGDRIGRQKVLAMTIILMSGSTFMIGVLPDYKAIGPAAPLLLLLVRLLQGFSTGGEYGGAATVIAEYAPTRRRGFFGSFLEFGTLWGYVLGSLTVLLVNLLSSEHAMYAWAWRIPFLFALPLGLVGLYIRLRLEDTPAFRELTSTGRTAKSPLREAIARHWRMILCLIGIVFLLHVADYSLLTFMPTYLSDNLGLGSVASELTTIGVEVGMIAVIVPLGRLSDRIGRKPLLLTAALGYVTLSWPAIRLMQIDNMAAVALGFAIMGGLLVLILAVIGSTFPAMFPTNVRYGAFAIGYNISASLFGGTAAVVIGSLIEVTGSNLIPAYYLILAGAVALAPILLIPETAGVPINKVATRPATPDQARRVSAWTDDDR
jgi:MFS transporter, MHS family, proline/betaine transporter